ncbi:MAG: amidohydrolase [Thermoflexales bacterium]|nr:amidohydrolase [Thermoflexales bacterium]
MSAFDLLLVSCDVLTRDGNAYRVAPDCDIAISGNRIVEVLPTGQIDPGQAKSTVNAQDMFAIPGLINTHTHAAMVLFRGLAEDIPIESWFNDYIWPLESNEEPEDIYWGTLLAIAEMIQSGVTTFADHYFFCDEIAQAISETGIRAHIGWAVFGHEGLTKLDQTVDFARRWQGGAGGRITTWMAPHSPYLCDVDFLRETAARAKALGTGIHIHCSETHEQVTYSLEQHGVTPPGMLHRAGVFDVPVLLAHGIGLTPADIALLKDHDVAISQCPKTYMKLAMGTAPVRDLRAAGIPVGIGTDGVVSSNTLDVLEQMRLLALDQKQAAKDSTVLPIQEVLDIAFAGGAAALRSPDLGEIAPGKLADVVLLRTDGAHFFPRYDLLANLVYSARASDVDTVICDGKVLMQGRQLLTIDLPRVKAEVAARMQRLNQRATERRLATYPVPQK